MFEKNTTNTTAINCNVVSTFAGLNLTNMCDRSTIDALLMTLVYLLIVVVGLISNGSVILASIFERYGSTVHNVLYHLKHKMSITVAVVRCCGNGLATLSNILRTKIKVGKIIKISFDSNI